MKDYSFPISVSLSKSGHKIPTSKGVYLHSVYDPIKEASDLVTQNEKNLKTDSNILIMGLGFGYHIEAIRSKLQQFHGSEYEIYVIEPNSNIVELVRSEKLLNENKVKIICKKTLDEIFSDNGLVNFLIQKPRLIAHSASFNLYHSFFKEFMSFEKHDSFSTNMNILSNEGLKNMLLEEGEETSFSSAIAKASSRKEKESREAFLFDMYNYLSR